MTASRNREGLQSQDSSAGIWPNISVQRRQCTQSPQVLPSGGFIWSALSADRGKGARCSLMTCSWLIQQNSAALIRSTGCRWAWRGVHAGGVGGGRGPRPATGDGLGLKRQVFFVRDGGPPETRPMRGDIEWPNWPLPARRRSQPSGLLRPARWFVHLFHGRALRAG